MDDKNLDSYDFFRETLKRAFIRNCKIDYIYYNLKLPSSDFNADTSYLDVKVTKYGIEFLVSPRVYTLKNVDTSILFASEDPDYEQILLIAKRESESTKRSERESRINSLVRELKDLNLSDEEIKERLGCQYQSETSTGTSKP